MTGLLTQEDSNQCISPLAHLSMGNCGRCVLVKGSGPLGERMDEPLKGTYYPSLSPLLDHCEVDTFALHMLPAPVYHTMYGNLKECSQDHRLKYLKHEPKYEYKIFVPYDIFSDILSETKSN